MKKVKHLSLLSQAGGMPEMTLEWILRENGIDPDKDLTIDTSISFAAMSGSFISGIGDYVSLFEHNVFLWIDF